MQILLCKKKNSYRFNNDSTEYLTDKEMIVFSKSLKHCKTMRQASIDFTK